MENAAESFSVLYIGLECIAIFSAYHINFILGCGV